VTPEEHRWSPARRGPIEYNTLSSALLPVLHPVHCECAHPAVGQLVQKDAVMDSIKSLTKIKKTTFPSSTRQVALSWKDI